jgi:hypothetical protein
MSPPKQNFNQAALDYFASHGIRPEIASAVGVHLSGGLRFPYYDELGSVLFERKRDMMEGKVYQPAGKGLLPWTPVGTGPALIVFEGESDCLAALSAMYKPAPAPACEVQRRDDLPPPLVELTPVALPGAGVCHGALADLVEELDASVLIAFDGDEAGRVAAAKLKEKISHATSIDLPDGKDLADLLAAADDPTAALAELVAEAEAAAEDVPVEGDADDEEAAEVKPLPNDAVAGLLDQVTATLDRFVILPGEHERNVLALFAAHTWAIEGAHATPYVLVVSPEKRSGKSRLLQVLELLVARPWGVIGASEAAMFRKIAKAKPTLLLDEIDAIFGANAERTEPLRAILNAGNRPGATVARCVGEGADVEDFPIYCAKVLAGIDTGHRIPDTVRDRSVTISMVRKTGGEPVERLRWRDADAEVQPLREALERWAVGAIDLLLAANPELPLELDDRAAEAWEPLLAIANMAGGEWPERARAAALALSGDGDRDEVTTGAMLLGAIREAFGDAEKLATSDLLSAVNSDEELPFGAWRDGKGLDSRGLARLLKPYGIRPRTVELPDGRSLKGYPKEKFCEPWERWLPTPTRTEPSEASEASEDIEPVSEKPHGKAVLTDLTDLTAISNADGNGGPPDATPDQEAEIERITAKLGGAA